MSSLINHRSQIFGFQLLVGFELTKCIANFCAVNYEVRLEDGTLVAKSDGVEFTVQDGNLLAVF